MVSNSQSESMLNSAKLQNQMNDVMTWSTNTLVANTGSGEIIFVCGGAVLSRYVSHTIWLYTNTGCIQLHREYNQMLQV